MTLFDPVAPRYGTGSLADVLPSALAVLGVPGVGDPLGLRAELAGVRRIAVLLVDGLGAYQIGDAHDAPALQALPGRHLTSGFPSTTPVSLVTLGTGAPPGAHGVLGFSVRTPDGGILNHIRWQDQPDPAAWQPLPTRWQQAAAAGVAVTVVTRAEYAGSGLSEAANRGGAFRGAADPGALAATMLDALRHSSAPALVSGYHPDVDNAGHIHGVASAEWQQAVTDVDRLVARVADGLPADAALLVTADHGQFDVPAEGRFDLGADPRLAAGLRAVAGEPRVRYLHTEPGATADVLAAWRAVLGDAAWVGERAEAVAAGWFGPVPEAHLQRIGDVVVVCRDRHVVLAGDREPAFIGAMVGFHGGATAVEMTVPLLVARGNVGGGG
ncbi:alkaline phosphatase family protein [Spirilliplanes yamanashiensis]|uniref:Alkaline phosphatase family protein n=1 Tax=Spirilliplanes yamanashiensis TaxID=42233 RepID=A0A8J3Y7T2_9ACTN|nr:nucleotide pyrophosphatase/phosphodiesterase family protein [Spirilliplanes yamanashiensis]MDP9816937.1 hypothetical protein [Spirilliplanes yamanashiensis]GIJ03408.1 alkaline phosphatase family protein [Spirilliplanes yamanashiensis]